MWPTWLDRRPARGRPRQQGHDEAILEATLELAAEAGYTALTIEAVARRAGVSRPSVYRRWPSKPALLMAAIRFRYGVDLDGSKTTLRDDLLAVQYQQVEFFNDPAIANCNAALLADLNMQPELAEVWRREFFDPRRHSMRKIFDRAVQRGELNADYDLEWLSDLSTGPLIARATLRGRGRLTREDAESSVEAVMAYVAQRMRATQR